MDGSLPRRAALIPAASLPLAAEGMPMGGGHMPWPGFGRLVRDGKGFRYVPRPTQF